ncbi:MAG TPA: HAD family hydrolase [Bryobacteraceae bacterium]|jgi:putative hydrolase of the HAD superfamily|nr:HAD family hydrolase [Bryobacteraceae bacterium]
MTKISALLFDVNGTLIDIETDEWMEEAYRAVGHYLTYQGIRLRRGEVRDLYFQTMKEQFAGKTEKYPEFDVVAVWREILDRHATGVTRSLPPEKLAHMPLFLAEMQRGISRKRLRAFPQTLEALAHLKTTHKLAIVSDAQTAYGLPELRATGLAEFFDPIVISGDYGFRKPDPRLFQAALDKLGVSPQEALFIGNDHFRDIGGAREVGMKTILFCPGGTASGPEQIAADYCLYQYSDLIRAVEFFSGQ